MQHTQSSLRSTARALRAGALVATLLAFSGAAQSQAQSETESLSLADPANAIEINEADPESSVPTPEQAMKRPMEMGYLMMELSDRAELAKKKGDHAQAAKYYRAMGKAVPDRAVSFSKACAAHEAASQWAEAAEMCRAALGRGGVKIEDYARFVRVTLRKPGPLASADLEDIEAVIGELRTRATTPEGKSVTAELECELATRLEDKARTRACVAALKELGRDPVKTKVYEWALAMMENDEQAARDILVKAKAVGATPGALASMQRELDARSARTASAPSSAPNGGNRLPSWLPIAAVAFMIAIAATVLMMRKRGNQGV